MSWLPPEILKSSVMMLRLQMIKSALSWNEVKDAFIGTGFLVQYKDFQFLVSNRHVVTKYPKGNPQVPRNNLAIAYEHKSGKPELLSIEKNQKNYGTIWSFPEDSEIDLAVTPIGIEMDRADAVKIHESVFGNLESVFVGEDIFFIGFPLGLTPGFHIKPVVRSGIISLIIGDKSIFLLDAISKGGNSGSPVFSKTRLIDPISNVIRRTNSKLLGVISGHIPDYANSRTDLAVAVGVNQLAELLNKAYRICNDR